MEKRFGTLALLAAVALIASVPAFAKPPADDDRVGVDLSAARAELRTTDDVVVRFTLVNRGARPLAVYLPDTPFTGEIENDLFMVTRDGEAVAYLGIVAKRAAPEPDDFIHLAPGQSRSVDVELSALYDMSQPGTYAIQYRAANAEMAARIGDSTASNLLWLTLTGHGRPSPLATAAPAPLAATNTYTNCTNTQAAQLAQARTDAANYASSASSVLNTGAHGTRYTTWFGAYDSTRFNTVKGHYVNITSALSTQAYNFDCKCKKKYYAYVYPTQPYNVYLCSVYWQAPATGTDSKAGTLIHETSHFNVVASTDDWTYGQTNCKSLAISDPSKAIDNADSHEYYAENTPTLPN